MNSADVNCAVQHPPAELLPGFADLPASLVDAVTHAWRAYTERLGTTPLPEAPSPWLQAVTPVFATSAFVARTCARRPELLDDLVSGGDLFRDAPAGGITARISDALGDAPDAAVLARVLRRERLRESLRVAWRDLAGWADLDEVMRSMSALADACIDAAVRVEYDLLAARSGTPRNERDGAAVPFVVLGLGKLGGEELNFSSDVDLIYAYPEEGETDGRRPVSNREFFTRLGRRLMAALTDLTEDGFVFRVDLRLRPNGDSGPLVLSFDATEHYYQAHGRDWERYAMIKARPVGGDLAAGQRLLNRLRPFVYRKYLDYGAFDAIRSMKTMIERELLRKGVAGNVKLGRGGIREVEFIAQSFQLIRGGRELHLQGRRLLPTLSGLANSGVLRAQAVEDLAAGYRFLRNVEHRLQMFDDCQEHVLPKDDTARLRLALAAGFNGWAAFIAHYDGVTDGIHRHFQQVFAPERGNGDDPLLLALIDAWQCRDEELESAGEALARAGYREPRAALALLCGFRAGSAWRAQPASGRERLEQLVPLLARAAGATEDPDATLGRVLRVIQSIGRRSAYLALLADNETVREQLVRLSATSPWIANWISQQPILLDELLEPVSDRALPRAEELERELDTRLAALPGDDLDTQMDVLRELRHGYALRVAMADVLGLAKDDEVRAALSGIAEVIVRAALRLAVDGLAPRFGRPADETPGDPPGLAVIAYGKLGSRELGYHADLDIVFMYAGDAGDTEVTTTGGERSLAREYYFGRVAQRVVHILTTRTALGDLYEIDMRLRPSGRSGTLVTSLEAFAGYQGDEAWTWEHQALVRARPIAGPQPVQAGFERIRTQILCRQRDHEALAAEIVKMRERMVAAHDRGDAGHLDLKHGRGGIVDVEFLVQYYVLRHAHDTPALTRERGTVELIEALAAAARMPAPEARALADAYRLYLRTELACKLQERPPLVAREDVAAEIERISAWWRNTFEQT
jgi:[glutamine synthetase] adenylyltransferase / [glutamine synthetase]-adenylyl-L-tyrosine phosphorylase